jgi:hypothetical protein
MRAVICIPRRGQQEDYDRAWSILEPYYRSSIFEMFISDSPGRFNLPAARNLAANMAGNWDVAVFINSDNLIPIESLKRGFEHALDVNRLVIPWDHYWAMSDAGHKSGYDLEIPVGNYFLEQRWIRASESLDQPLYAPGGSVIIPRTVFDRVGGYDERFIGYQPEDAAILIEVEEFDRLSGPAYHFWHPRGSDPFYIEADGAWPVYREKFLARKITQHLVDEGRDIHDFGGWWWG